MTVDFIFSIIVLIFSVIIHEVSHGYAAYVQGDNTAKFAGRLTLNPFKHLDWFGSFLLPVMSYFLGGFIIGWAKPVPFNPYNLRNQRWGDAIVAIAGPLSNIAIALVFGLFIRFGLSSGLVGGTNILKITSYIVYINLLLAIFNLVPIPPLDGSKILFSILRVGWNQKRLFLERFGFILVLVFIFFLWPIVSPLTANLFVLITGLAI